MTVSILSREDLATMAITDDQTILVYSVDGGDVPDITYGTAREIENYLEDNAKILAENSKIESLFGVEYTVSLDDAKESVWNCASICDKNEYDLEQSELN